MNNTGEKIKSINEKQSDIEFDILLHYVQSSSFFVCLEPGCRCRKLRESILQKIDLRHLDLPQRLHNYLNKNNIRTLDELLGIDPKQILISRNLGKESIKKAQKIILSYLYENEEYLDSFCKKLCCDDISYLNNIKKYYPLLQGFYKTTELYFHFLTKDISSVKIPQRINDYLKKSGKIETIGDLLNISYKELIRTDKIGCSTIKTLQYTLIEFLHLEKITSVPCPGN